MPPGFVIEIGQLGQEVVGPRADLGDDLGLARLLRRHQRAEAVDLADPGLALLAGWARARLQANDAESFEMASGYVSRCSLLPGLSEEQRSELKALRADLAYRNGKRLAYAIADDFDKAVAELQLALELGTSRPSDADAWVTQMTKWASEYRAALGDRTKPEGAPSAPPAPSVPTTEAQPVEKSKGEAL
jgi:hypothetical protein